MRLEGEHYLAEGSLSIIKAHFIWYKKNPGYLGKNCRISRVLLLFMKCAYEIFYNELE